MESNKKVKGEIERKSQSFKMAVSLFRDLFMTDVETGVPGGKPPKKKFLFDICVFSDIFCLWVETGVPGVKPPSQIPASKSWPMPEMNGSRS